MYELSYRARPNEGNAPKRRYWLAFSLPERITGYSENRTSGGSINLSHPRGILFLFVRLLESFP